ncbi:MAG: endonuclease MutS2, partial [Oscillospiraceae bacterium]|nr:endonuclease MutS2 [Oscillospiraceae bacterium]
MDLFEKSLNVLELPAVLEMLASEAVCAEAKSRARALKPSTNRFEVADRLSETTDAKKLLVVKGTPAISDVRDVGESLGRARMGGMLNMRELLDIAVVLRCARSVAAYADASDAGSLTGLFRSLHPNKYLEERITDSIVSEEEMADSASSELAMIRRKIRAANARVREILQRMITSASYQKALQEPIITQRGDRYVIPVKAEHRGSVAGLVHDVSSSGATLFIEPMSVVEANNEIRELEVKEKREIERILMELSDEAANFEDDIRTDYDVIARLDLIFAKAKLSSLLNCSEPELSEGWKTTLRRARHPL